MRSLLIIAIAFLLPAMPLRAEDRVQIPLHVKSITIFVIHNAVPLTFIFDQYSDFGVALDIGDIDYDLQSNSGWQVEAAILDGVQSGQTADDWDASTWTLAVNGVAINEASNTIIDSDSVPVDRTHAKWQVLLTIPWPESVANPDCTIQLTASST